MLKLGAVAMLVLAGWAALEPRPMSWVFIAAVAAFELWLGEKIRNANREAGNMEAVHEESP